MKSGKKTRLKDLPQELVASLRLTQRIVHAYLEGLNFIVHDTARDEDFRDSHLLFYLAQDFLQSAVSIVTLATEGMLNVAKREVRFLVESSVKLCFVQQKSYASSIGEKIKRFDKELSSQRLSIKRNLILGCLPEGLHDDFQEEVGRIYGHTSNYVHLTTSHLAERIAAVEAGRTSGKESPADIEALNDLVFRGLACSLVLLFHSVPSYVAGDWFVEEDGSSVDWYFMRSRLIAGLDSYFDYKAERHGQLAKIRATREREVTF